MTIQQALGLAIIKLKNKTIKNPHLEAEILLSHIFKKSREFLLAHGEKKLSAEQLSSFKSQILKRITGVPIAYLIGYKEFYGYKFLVDRNVLVPRPETELMIDETKRITHNMKRVTIIDVGAGSGNIIISLAKELNSRIKNSDLRMIGIDISKKALMVAKKNAQLHKVNKNIKFIKGNLLNPLINNPSFIIPNSDLLILANLPYLTPSQIKNSPTIQSEPKSALSGGKNGLKIYEELFKQIKKLRVTSYELRDITALCEIDPRQTNQLKQLVKKYLPQAKLKLKKDLTGLNRLAIIQTGNN